jgi:hypothetical protein
MLAFAALLLLTTQNIAVPGRPDRLLAADLNGDGRAEIIAGCQQSVVVLLNDGKGRFRLASRTALSGNPTELSAGDFDEDGHMDVVAADHDTFGVFLLRGDGKGGLARMGFTRAQRAGRPHVHGLLSGDWNRDGKTDAIHFNIEENTAVVLLGDGKGELSPAQRLPLGSPNNPALGDWNSDGIADIAAAAVHQNQIFIALGDGQGGFVSAPASPIRVAARPYFTATGDLNNDGHADIAATHDDTGLLTVLYGDGRGGFGQPREFLLGGPAWAVKVLDANGDGRNDVVARSGSGYRILPQQTNGTLQARPIVLTLADSDNWSFTAADFNGDGRQDFASSHPNANAVNILFSAGLPPAAKR